MDRLLSIGEVAKRLRVSVDVVRSLTESGELKGARTGGGHRRYRPEEVERWKATRRAPAKNARLERPTRKPSNRGEIDEPDVEEDQPTLEDLDAEFERQERRERAEAERQRLEGLKRCGRDLAQLEPTDLRARIFEDLEEFVSSKRVPPSLSVTEAQVIIAARVRQIAKQYRDAENQRLARERDAAAERQRTETERQQRERDAAAERQQRERDAAAERQRVEDERRKQEREADEQRRKQQEDERKLKALIDHGNTHAWCETINGWDRSEAERARRDVARALKEDVKVDWTEDEVDDLVDDVLNEGDEDEEEEGDESW